MPHCPLYSQASKARKLYAHFNQRCPTFGAHLNFRPGPSATLRRDVLLAFPIRAISGYSERRGVKARLLHCTLLLLSLLLGAVGRPSLAQELDTSAPAGGSTLTVYLATIGPGKRVWERFGHNALWVRDTLRGIDRAYNYGMFSFQQESFLMRFVRGEMLYWMAGFDGERHLEVYAADNRSVWIQELNLEPHRRAALFDYLEWNDRPQNRFYRYDYYRDNCSSRVRDALDRVLNGRLYDLTAGAETGTTYRFHTRRLLAPDVAAYVGTLFSLGRAVDRPISAWEEMFLPVRMMKTLREVTVLDANRREVPLVRAEFTLYESTLPPERQTAPDWLLGFLSVGVLLSAGLLLAAWHGSAHRGPRIIALTGISLWALLLGLGAVFMVLVWGFTQHWAGTWNENLFFFSPVALPLALLMPVAAAGKAWAARWALWLAVAVVGVSAVGVLVQLLPWFDQVNGEIIAAVLPLNLAMGWAVYRLDLAGKQSSRERHPMR